MTALARLDRVLDELARVPSRVSRPIADDLATLIDKQFARGVDAYGKAWNALRPYTIAKGRGWPPLSDTHDMRDRIRVTPRAGSGIEFFIPDPGRFHQFGWTHHWQGLKVRPRPILPHRGTLPREWRAVIDRRMAEAFQRSG